MRNRIAVSILAACVAGCAPEMPRPSAAIATVALKNADFEASPLAAGACAAGWDCTMHADPTSFRFVHEEKDPAGGKRSFCIEPLKKEPLAIVSQGVFDPALRGARVRLSIAVKLEGVTGNGAGPFMLAYGPTGVVISHGLNLEKGTQGWRRRAVEMTVPLNAYSLEVGLTLEGAGRACLDDAVLEVMPAKSPV